MLRTNSSGVMGTGLWALGSGRLEVEVIGLGAWGLGLAAGVTGRIDCGAVIGSAGNGAGDVGVAAGIGIGVAMVGDATGIDSGSLRHLPRLAVRLSFA